MLALVLVVAALAISIAVMLTSSDDVAMQNTPAATDAVPAYTGDWKDSFVGGDARNITLIGRPNEQPTYTGDWKDMLVGDGR